VTLTHVLTHLIQARVALGTVPDWIAAFGSVFATVFVAIGLLREIKRRRLEDEQVAAERRAAEANQARLVNVLARVRGNGQRVEFIVRNDSASPVLNPVPFLFWGEAPEALHVPDVVPAAEETLIGPNSSWDTLVALVDSEMIPPSPSAIHYAVGFTDIDGRRWLRIATRGPLRVLSSDQETLLAAIRAHLGVLDRDRRTP